MNHEIRKPNHHFHMMIFFKILMPLCIIILLPAINSCSVYHPMPITAEAVNAGLVPPDMAEVRVRAGELKHPLLKSISFDDRDGLSPEEAAILAVIANPALRAIRDRRGIASAQLLDARILPNPEIAYDLEIPVGADTSGKINGNSLGLNWDITSLITRSARTDAAKFNASSIDLDIAWQEWQVAQAARLGAYHLFFAEKKLAAARLARGAFQQLLTDVKQGVAMGEKTQLDLSSAETAYQDAESRVLTAQATMEMERLSFNRALGLPSDIVISLEKYIVPQLGEYPPKNLLLKDTETKRLDLLALKLGYESQEARVRSSVWSRFPKINLGLTGNRDTDSNKSIGIGVSIDLPFFDRNQGRIAEERANRSQLFDEYTARIFETHADMDRIMSAIENLKQQITHADQSLTIQQVHTENCRHAAEAGQIDIFSYYQALNDLHENQIRRIDLAQNMIDLGIALEIASGHFGLVMEQKDSPRKKQPAGETEMPK